MILDILYFVNISVKYIFWQVCKKIAEWVESVEKVGNGGATDPKE